MFPGLWPALQLFGAQGQLQTSPRCFFSRVVHSFQGLKKLEVDCEGGRRDVPVREWLLSQKHLEDLQIVNYRD